MLRKVFFETSYGSTLPLRLFHPSWQHPSYLSVCQAEIIAVAKLYLPKVRLWERHLPVRVHGYLCLYKSGFMFNLSVCERIYPIAALADSFITSLTFRSVPHVGTFIIFTSIVRYLLTVSRQALWQFPPHPVECCVIMIFLRSKSSILYVSFTLSVSSIAFLLRFSAQRNISHPDFTPSLLCNCL